LSISSFYKNVRVQKGLKKAKAKYNKVLDDQLIKKAEKEAIKDVDKWYERKTDSKEENFKLLAFQRALLTKATAEMKKDKIDIRDLDLIVRILERLVDIGNKIMGVHEEAAEMPTNPYGNEIQIADKIEISDIPGYKKYKEEVEGESKKY